jgi:hypothetical protein
MSDLTDAMVDGFGTAVTDILAGIGSILPILIPIVAAFALIRVGYALFKKFGK